MFSVITINIAVIITTIIVTIVIPIIINTMINTIINTITKFRVSTCDLVLAACSLARETFYFFLLFSLSFFSPDFFCEIGGRMLCSQVIGAPFFPSFLSARCAD